MKFRKKPVVIEATQWFKNGDHPAVKLWNRGGHVYPNGTALIETLEGDLHVTPGDWIITGAKGENYPCKPDIFAATYDAAEPPIDNAHVAPGCEQFSVGHINANAMPPHQQRVVDERVELSDKLGKLEAFANTQLFAGLDEAERRRLMAQHGAMFAYSAILSERIAAFPA